jgi:hypothetical protein
MVVGNEREWEHVVGVDLVGLGFAAVDGLM